MDFSLASYFAPFWAAPLVLLIVLAVPWFLLPFAVFGIKEKIDRAIDESRRTTLAIEALTVEVKGLRAKGTESIETPRA